MEATLTFKIRHYETPRCMAPAPAHHVLGKAEELGVAQKRKLANKVEPGIQNVSFYMGMNWDRFGDSIHFLIGSRRNIPLQPNCFVDSSNSAVKKIK